MTTVAPLTSWSDATFRRRVETLIDVYVAAMRYPPEIVAARTALWLEHSRRPGFACVVATAGVAPTATPAPGPPGTPPTPFTARALDAHADVLGLAYGYHGAPGQWWYSEVRRGLGAAAPAYLSDFFELTELHVRPGVQGRGLGEALLRALAADRPEPSILLSTPEGESRAWRLYRRMGFADVLRNFRFTGDLRPFGVLGRPLPFDPADQRA